MERESNKRSTDVVGSPESFELEEPLQAVAKAALELCCQLAHTLVLSVVQQRTHRLQVLRDNTTTNKTQIPLLRGAA